MMVPVLTVKLDLQPAQRYWGVLRREVLGLIGSPSHRGQRMPLGQRRATNHASALASSAKCCTAR